MSIKTLFKYTKEFRAQHGIFVGLPERNTWPDEVTTFFVTAATIDVCYMVIFFSFLLYRRFVHRVCIRCK